MRRLVLSLLALAFGVGAAVPQTVRERIERDELAVRADDDPLIVEAIRNGRATLPDFFKLAQSPRPSMSNFSIKVAVRAGDRTEYFWLSGFKREGDRYTGRLNNTPRWALHLKEGQTIAFEEHEIVDWLYIEDGKMKGNFTFCALMQREDRRDALAMIKRFGADCILERQRN